MLMHITLSMKVLGLKLENDIVKKDNHNLKMINLHKP